MAISDYEMAPEALHACEHDGRCLALIDLDRCPADIVIPVLPPFPMIGFGDAGHPLASRLDTVIEPPVSADRLIATIEKAPRAASVLVQLLRSIEHDDSESALTSESMALAMLQASAEHVAWLDTRTQFSDLPPGKANMERDGDCLRVEMDRPWARNAIDTAMRDDLHAAFTVAALDPDIRRIRLRGAGTAFSIGADLAEFGTTRDPATAHDIRMRTLPARALARFDGRIEVHVQGACVGSGLEMAAFATRLTAGRAAWFQLPELAMGIIPGAGGCVSVMRRIGRQRAALMMLSGRRFDAATALRWELIDAIVDPTPLDEDGADMIG